MSSDDAYDEPHTGVFAYGDVVRHRLSPAVIGIVVDSFEFGNRYLVKLSAFEEDVFHGVELEYVGGDLPPKPAKPAYVGNIINLAEARAKGAA